jgi:hypothetical protein
MSAYITISFPQRKKVISKKKSREKKKLEDIIHRFRLLYARRDKVQRVRRSYHCSKLGVRPRSVQLMYDPSPGIAGFRYDERLEVNVSPASKTRLKKVEHVVALNGSVVAVLAPPESTDQFWFFQLSADLIATDAEWVTRRMEGRFLEVLPESDEYILGSPDTLSVQTFVCNVEAKVDSSNPEYVKLALPPNVLKELQCELQNIRAKQIGDEEDLTDTDEEEDEEDEEAEEGQGHEEDESEEGGSGRARRRRRRPSWFVDYYS